MIEQLENVVAVGTNRQRDRLQFIEARDAAIAAGMTLTNPTGIEYELTTKAGKVTWLPDESDWDPEHLLTDVSIPLASFRPCPTDLLTFVKLVVDVVAAWEPQR